MITIRCSISLFIIICGINRFCSQSVDESRWIESENLHKWYTKFDLCLLANNKPEKIEDMFENCKKKYDIGNQPFRCMVGNSWPSRSGFCASADITYQNRINFRRAVRGFDDPSSHPLRIYFDKLSKLNGALLLIGDSVMQQFFGAIACELERENVWNDPSQFTNTDEVKYVESSNSSFPSVPIKFTPIYHFVNGRFDRIANASMHAVKTSVEAYIAKYDYVYVMMNVGLHYVSNPLAHFSRGDYTSQLVNAFTYLNDVAIKTKKLYVFWRETTAQHFPTSNGYWPGQRYAPGMKLACLDIKDKSKDADWRNQDIRKIIEENNFQIKIIPFYNITLPLWNMHVNGHLRDCTHFCWTPMLYQYLFHYMKDSLP